MVPEGLEPWVRPSRREQGILIQIKTDAATRHAQFVLVSDYPLSARLGKPIRQQQLPKNPGIEMWINLQKIGWQRCTPREKKECTITSIFICSSNIV